MNIIKKLYEMFKDQIDKRLHFFVTIGLLYYLGLLDAVFNHFIGGFVAVIALTIIIFGFKEIVIDLILGGIFKLKGKIKFIGEFDWYDLLFDALGLITGLLALFMGYIVLSVFI